MFDSELTWVVLSLLSVWWGLRLKQRLELSLAKHPSLGGHLRWAKRIARWIPGYSYSPAQWFSVDGAPADVISQRQQSLSRLGQTLRDQSPLTLAHSAAAKPMISDLQMISHYRVPFQFRDVLQSQIQLGSFWSASQGVWLIDLDGNRFIDVTGSYGVNVFGLDFYKSCIDEGAALVRDLGPVLGSYHPCVLDNVQRLCRLAQKDEVSFHMSGTEAVMQAVRLARFHTGKTKVVRFTGAYHGWWDDVQPGPGNPMPPSDQTLTLREMHPSTLRVLRNRSDIACVLVNPLQALHPNRAAPTDSTLVDGNRSAHFEREAYGRWLQELRTLCTERGIALIFDEVFMGFRLGAGGAQDYFKVQADLVTYGKTLGGGLPVGVICGTSKWMRRFGQSPGDLCFARGTFNAHPYVMGAMNVFLRRLESPELQQIYQAAEVVWEQRQQRLNQQLEQAGLPVRVAGMATVWTVLYQQPSRYNWLLQFYLREQGLALSWVGSGRMIFSLNFDDSDFDLFCKKFIQAAQQMSVGGWWWTPEGQSNSTIKRELFKEMLRARYAFFTGDEREA